MQGVGDDNVHITINAAAEDVFDRTRGQTRIPNVVDTRCNDVVARFGGGGGQRSKEYDTVSDVYFNFIETEVLPTIETNYNVKFTTDPEGRAAMGGSSGAPAAMGMAWFGNFRRILTYSGTFVNLQSSTMYPHGAWEYHENLIPSADPRPIRIFLEVGDQDNGYMTPASGFRNWVLGNQGMAAALKAKGYHYRFVLGTGGVGHVDGGIIGQTLPESLLWLWRGYPH
jgi:enterochelin esterase-like enzyme